MDQFNLEQLNQTANMKKKWLIIYLKDGREIKRDLTLEKIPGVPIGADANDPGYLPLCLFYVQHGITDVENTNANQLTLIGPAMIVKIVIKFEPV